MKAAFSRLLPGTLVSFQSLTGEGSALASSPENTAVYLSNYFQSLAGEDCALASSPCNTVGVYFSVTYR